MSETLNMLPASSAPSLSITRRLRGMSDGALGRTVKATMDDEALLHEDVDILYPSRYAANILSADEYDKQMVENDELALQHPLVIARCFNKYRQSQSHNGLNEFLNDVSVGRAGFSEVSEGKFIVGFMMSDDYIERLAEERPVVIDTVLDIAHFSKDDPIRQWGEKGCDTVSLPIFDLYTTDPEAESILTNFTSALTSNIDDLSIDLYEAKARPTTPTVSTTFPQNQAA